MPVEPGDHLEITVLASASGQTVMNIFNYRSSPGNGTSPTLLSLVAQFQADWRLGAIPMLHSDYVVQAYIGRILHSMVYLPVTIPMSPTARPALRYREQAILQGDPENDKGDVETPAAPTFQAVSIQKVCNSTTDPAGFLLPAEKIMRGSMRLGPIGEIATEDLEGNALTAAAIVSAQEAATEIQVLTSGSSVYPMEVLSFYKDGVHRSADGIPVWANATVNSFLINPYVSTQNTRKQRSRGGA